MADSDAADAFTYNGGRVDPGETQHVRYSVSETYLGDPIRIPVTIINGAQPGPTLFLSAAIHGDELNGVAVVREIADTWSSDDLHGTLVCLPVLNVPGFLFQERYLPVQDRDLNRAFPGHPESTSAKRMAHDIFQNFIAPCDLGLDFHTSTRGRTNMLHVRADMDDPWAARLAHAFGANVILDSSGPAGALRREATEAGTPTITIEMGEAHRFQREFIDRGLAGVENVLAALDVSPAETAQRPCWRVVSDRSEKTWLRAPAGGLVEMHADRGAVAHADDPLCTITDPFGADKTHVTAPFTGVVVGVLENPVVSPGNPLCHFVELPTDVAQAVQTRSQAAALTPDQSVGVTGE